MPAGQVWAVNTLGGFLSNTKLSKRLRHKAQPLLRFRQFADMSDGSGKGRGDTHVFNKVSNISTAGGTLVETNTMPERQLTMTQGTMTITEYGNSIPYTFKLQLVSDFDVPEMIQKALMNDQAKVLDSACAAEFQSAHTKVVLSSTTSTVFTTNGTATATSTANLGKANVKDIVDYLRKNNVPPYDGSNYVCIGSTELLSQLKDDMESFDQYTFEGQKQIQDGKFFPRYEGEVGLYYGCRFSREPLRAAA